MLQFVRVAAWLPFVSGMSCTFVDKVVPGVIGTGFSLLRLQKIFVVRCFPQTSVLPPWRFIVFIVVSYLLPVLVDKVCRDGLRGFVRVAVRLVNLPSDAEMYSVLRSGMVDYSFNSVFLPYLFLRWVVMVFITCPWCIAGDLIALVYFRTWCSWYTVDRNNIFDFILLNQDELRAHADDPVQIQFLR